MNFSQHLHEFLGESVDEAEAREIARTVIATTVRSLKLAIGERLWLARQTSQQGDTPKSADHLNAARSLKQRYDSAWAEYQDSASGSTARAAEHGSDPGDGPAGGQQGK